MPVEVTLAIRRAVEPPPSHVIFQDVEQVLRRRHETPEAYTQGLPKGRRETVRREMREYAESDSAAKIVPFDEAPLPDLAHMHANLMRTYGHEYTDEESLAGLESQHRHFGDRGLVFTSVQNSRPTGFSLCYEHAGSLYVRSTGYDYDATTPFSYSKLMLDEPLATVMEKGWRDLQLGLSTHQAKLLRGADALPLYAVLCPAEPASAEAVDDVLLCSEERIAEFWQKYGQFVIHQTIDDLRLPARAPGQDRWRVTRASIAA